MALSTPPAPGAQYWLDRRWIHDNYGQLVASHANEWIAVHRGQILAAGPDLGAVEDTARPKSASPDVVYQFIDDGSLLL